MIVVNSLAVLSRSCVNDGGMLPGLKRFGSLLLRLVLQFLLWWGTLAVGFFSLVHIVVPLVPPDAPTDRPEPDSSVANVLEWRANQIAELFCAEVASKCLHLEPEQELVLESCDPREIAQAFLPSEHHRKEWQRGHLVSVEPELVDFVPFPKSHTPVPPSDFFVQNEQDYFDAALVTHADLLLMRAPMMYPETIWLMARHVSPPDPTRPISDDMNKVRSRVEDVRETLTMDHLGLAMEHLRARAYSPRCSDISSPRERDQDADAR